MVHALEAALEKRLESGNLREINKIEGVDFCSNDYLGLAADALGVPAHASGSTGSRLISGHDAAITQTEQQIAAFHGFEAGLLFSSGYAANTGLMACIAGPEDAILSDELIHASLIDGIRLSYARRERFAHNDLQDLEGKLQALRAEVLGQIYVAVEALYSMDGDVADLKAVCAVCERYKAALVVDEAHSVGVYGREGRGLVAQAGVQDQVFAAVYTFGKAPGYHGAIIVGGRILRDYLVNFCRPFIYTTAPSPQTIAETQAAYHRFQQADAARESLGAVLSYFAQHVKAKPLRGAQWLESDSPIQGLLIPGNARAKACAAYLGEQGLAVKAILAPTVPEGSERLRMSLHSFNTEDQMDRLANGLAQFLNGGEA